MKPVVCIASCALLLAPLAASATPPPDDATSTARAAVERDLVRPLRQKEAKRSKFSRAALPPKERRVRILDAVAVQDARGSAFRRFSVDARWALGDDDAWDQGVIVGCRYEEDGSMFVQVGHEYRAASFLLGKKSQKAPAEACRAAEDGKVARVDEGKDAARRR